MSPTLLEIVAVVVLLLVAWQIGLDVAPQILRRLRRLPRTVDDVATEAMNEERLNEERLKGDGMNEDGHDRGRS